MQPAHTPIRFVANADLRRVKLSTLSQVSVLRSCCRGNQCFLDSLDWTGYKAFTEVPGEGQKEVVGHIKPSDDMAFLTVEGAGHMVP